MSNFESPARPIHAWCVPGWDSEKPGANGTAPEIWCYTDKFSYQAGEIIQLHTHTTETVYDVKIVRDGSKPVSFAHLKNIEGQRCVTPHDAYATGCNWPVSTTIPVDPAWPTGFYLIIASIESNGIRKETEHFFVLRPSAAKRGKVALILTTSTLLAYNDWGGANAYRGMGQAPFYCEPSPVQSAARPIARGLLRVPAGAPRSALDFTPPPGWIPTHANIVWAQQHGYSRHYSDAFWATYERPFVVWTESQGYELDYLTQHDLHFDTDALAGYTLAILVGHDEYWSWEMRDRVDAFIEQGGNLARFGGNFIWQVRLSDDGNTQECYRLPSLDPLRESNPSRVTTAWDSPVVGRPATHTMGLTGLAGCYNRYGNAAPRSSGGYTVYRPGHWVFEGTDLYYGDNFGVAPVSIAAFELDSVEYTMRKGLPYPTGEDGASPDLEILAMAPATCGQDDRWQGQVPLGAPAHEVLEAIDAIFEGNPPEHMRDRLYGAGMIAVLERGKSTTFNAGTTEWVSGLIHDDPYTVRITRNVLDRLSA